MGFWLEVVTLVVPGFNDSAGELRWPRLSFWPAFRATSRGARYSVSAKDYKMLGPGKHATRPRWCGPSVIGRAAGLRYVYTGNSPGETGGARGHAMSIVWRRHAGRTARIPRAAKSHGERWQVSRLHHRHPRNLGRAAPPPRRERRSGSHSLRLERPPDVTATHTSPFAGTLVSRRRQRTSTRCSPNAFAESALPHRGSISSPALWAFAWCRTPGRLTRELWLRRCIGRRAAAAGARGAAGVSASREA